MERQGHGIDDANRSSAPPAPTGGPGVASSGEMDLPCDGQRMAAGFVVARLGDRVLALILDSALGFSFFALVGMYSASKWGGFTEHGFSLEGKPAAMSLGAVLSLGFLYYLILEGLLGCTLGKAIMGLRVRMLSGDPCGFKASLTRNLLRLVDSLGLYLVGFLIASFSKARQRLGDHLAKTVVVEHPTPTILRAAVVVVWLLLVATGPWLAYGIHRGASPQMASGSTQGTELQVRPAQGEVQTAPAESQPESAKGERDLAVVDFAFLKEEGGAPRSEGPFKPGEKVYTRFQVVGFAMDSQGAADLSFDVVATDPSGLPLYENWQPTFQGKVKGPDSPVPASMEFDLPIYAPAGSYSIRIKVRDMLRDLETELVRGFQVGPAQVRPASGLEIRDFVFSMSEEGPPLARPVVEAGKRIYMIFNVAGVSFRGDEPDAVVGMQVKDPEGEIVLDQPAIASIGDTVIYHPPTFFAKITSWLDLPPDIPKGTYRTRFVVTDRIAGKVVAQEAEFEVR